MEDVCLGMFWRSLGGGDICFCVNMSPYLVYATSRFECADVIRVI